MQTQILQDYFEHEGANPAAIETVLHRASENIPVETKTYSKEFNVDVVLELACQPQAKDYKFKSLCDDDDDDQGAEDNQRSIKGENQKI